MYLSDRDRLSVAIFPAMLGRWYRRVIELAEKPNAHDHQVMRWLIEAEDLAYQDLDPNRRFKLRLRVERLHDALLGGREGEAMIKVFLALAYAMGDLIAQDRMSLCAGSPLARAYDDIAEVVAQHESMISGADKSATKAARKIVETLTRERVF